MQVSRREDVGATLSTLTLVGGPLEPPAPLCPGRHSPSKVLSLLLRQVLSLTPHAPLQHAPKTQPQQAGAPSGDSSLSRTKVAWLSRERGQERTTGVHKATLP